MLLLLTFGFLLVLAGCTNTPEPLTEYNVLGSFVDSGDEVYDITTNTEQLLEFDYAKATFPDAYLSKTIDKDLSDLKKLVITVQGTGSILVRLENEDGTVSKVVSLNVTGIEGSYEWNLSNDSEFLKTIARIEIVGAPGKEESIGSVEVSELKFYATVADNYIIQTDFNNIPDNVNEYNGTDVEFHFNAKWANFAEETYTITYDGTDTVVSFTKPAGQEWSTMGTKVQGDFSKFNYVVAVVSGTTNQQFLLKAANGYESRVKFDGTEQEVAVDISEMTDEEKNAITDIFVFGLPGAAGSGEFTIHDIYFTETYEIPVVEIIKNNYNGTDETFSLQNWYDFGDLVYTATKDGTDTILSYDKNTEWALAATYIEGDISEFGVLEFVISGEENKTAMFKIEGGGENIEMNVTFDGTRQVFKMKLNQMLKTSLQSVEKVMIFALPGGTGQGQMTIHSVTFMADEFSVNAGWTGNEIYTITESNGAVNVAYTRTAAQNWEFIRVDYTEDLSEYNVLNMVFQGEIGQQVIVKPNDNGAYEKTITFDGTEQMVTFDLPEPLTKILIFVDPLNASTTGEFDILDATMTYVMPPVVDPLVEVNTNWTDNGDTVYTVENLEGTIKVSYDKAAGQEWATMIQDFDQALSGYQVFEIHLEGTEGKQVLVKVNNSIEKWVTFDAEGKGSATIKAEAITSVLLFAEGGVAPASGEFYITAAFLKLEKAITEWIDNGDSVYTFEGVTEGIEVSYDKVAGQEWSTAKVEFDNEDAMFNTFTIHMTGTEGKQVLVKLNNSLEKWLTFDAEGKASVSVTLDAFSSVLLFAEGGVAPASGSFIITSAYLSYVAPEVKASISVNENWLDSGDAVYTFADITEGVEVTYNKIAGQEWATMKQEFIGDQLGYNTYTIHLEGTAGKQVLVKINNSIEKWVTFDAEGKGMASIMTGSIVSVHLFAEGGVAPANGTFKVISSVLSLEIDVNKDWADNGDGSNTVTKEGTTVVIDYDKVAGQEWTTLVQLLEGDFAKYNTFTIHMTGTSGKQVLVKVNNAIENWVTFDAEGNGQATITTGNITSVHLFAEGGVAPVSGQYVILSATLSFIAPDVKADASVNANWADSGDEVYTFTTNGDNSVTVNYTKVAGEEWATMNQVFEGELEGYTNFTITMTGTEGKQVLVKVNNSIEQWVTFDAEGNGTATITAGSIVSIHLFAEGGTADVSGSFTIVEAVLSQS
jgi:hypothetical protein